MRTFICLLLLTTAVFAQEEMIEPSSQETKNPDLIASTESVPKMNSPVIFPSQNQTLIDVGFYGAMNAGIFRSLLPSIGTSIRLQKGANGIELDGSVLPRHWEDGDAGVSYKIDFSYLYHLENKRSGIYLGGGPGFITNRHMFCPLAVTWVGYQFSSQFPNERRLHGFADGGVTTILEKDRKVIVFVPTIRAGIGFSF